MKRKVNKLTVATRITGDLKETLEQEAQENGLSFCKYLEQILLNRDSAFTDYDEDDDFEDVEHLKEERAFLVDKIKALENELALVIDEETEVDELAESEIDDEVIDATILTDLQREIEYLETRNLELQEDIEEDAAKNQQIIADLETQTIQLKNENQELLSQIETLTEVQPNQLLAETDALQFLSTRHPNLSKEEIIKTALDCSATNDGKGWYNTMYSFTDYLNRNKSFINHQNNEV